MVYIQTDVNKAHLVHLVIRRTNMVQVQKIRHGVIIADMAIPNPVIRKPGVVQVYNVNIAYMALPNLVIRQLRVVIRRTSMVQVSQYMLFILRTWP